MKTWILFGALVGLSVDASAQVARKAAERKQEARELAHSKAARRDDLRDAAWLDEIVTRFDAARERRDKPAFDRMERELRDYLREELTEDRVEAHGTRAEIARSEAELRDSRRELMRSAAVGAGERRTARDAREARDDRRDLKDDRRDAAAKASIVNGRRNIAHELRGLFGKTDGASLDRYRFLLTELQRINRIELRNDANEIREDRGEVRENRRF